MKKNIIIVSLNIFFLIAFLACQLISASIIKPFYNQQAARAWAGQSGERFVQLSVFLPDSSSFDVSSIMSTRASINTSLLTASLDTGGGRSLFADAWAAYGTVSILSDRGRTTTASAIGVGGDFFMFHPMQLRHGSYLSPNDIMKDLVVLDEELAWRLFGATRVTGMEVLINGKPFIISGVISRESDFASVAAYTAGEGLYMSYETLDAMMDGGARIASYEIVMPNPVSNFALNIVSDLFSQDGIHIVQNTERFSAANQLSIIGSFGERSMRTDTTAFPYWENAARFAEDRLALLLLLSIIFMVFPVICAVIYSVKLIRFGIKQLKKAIKLYIKKRDDRAYQRYKANQKLKLFGNK